MRTLKQLVTSDTLRPFVRMGIIISLIIFLISIYFSAKERDALLSYRIPITITLANMNIPTTVPPETASVGEALLALDIKTEGALISPPLYVELVPNISISVLDVQEIILLDGNKGSTTLFSAATTVGDALISWGISIGELDFVTPKLETALSDGMEIKITRILELERTETVPIPYAVTYIADTDAPWGGDSLISPGSEGVAEESIHLRYINGEIVERTVISKKILEPPINEKIKRGSKIEIDFAYDGGASWYAYRNCDCAASTKYPRGTWLRVTNLLNGKQVIVETNDWGPDPAVFPERIVDLDAIAFKKIAPLWKGVIPARVEHIVTE